MRAPKSLVPTVVLEPVSFESYKVIVTPVSGVVVVQLRSTREGYHTVRPPNWLERWRGITWRQKIEAAKQCVQRLADKMNAEEQAAKDVCREYEGS